MGNQRWVWICQMLTVTCLLLAAYRISELEIQQEELKARVAQMELAEALDAPYIRHLSAEAHAWRGELGLLTDHCLAIMDLNISLRRGGWWSDEAINRLSRISYIKRLREENIYHVEAR